MTCKGNYVFRKREIKCKPVLRLAGLTLWFCWLLGVGFYGLDVVFMRGFSSRVDGQFKLLSLLFCYAGLFDFIYAEAFTRFFFAVLIDYRCFYVVHLLFNLLCAVV